MKLRNLFQTTAATAVSVSFLAAGAAMANPFLGPQQSGQYSQGSAGGEASAEGGPGTAATGSTSYGNSWAVQKGGPGARIFKYGNNNSGSGEEGGYERTGFPGRPANSAHQAQQQKIGNESYATFEGQNGDVSSQSGSGLEMGQGQTWQNFNCGQCQ